MNDMFQSLMHEFYNEAFGPVILDTAAYAKAQRIDLELAMAHAGALSLHSCTLDGGGYFDFDPNGEPCLVFEVLDEDAITTVDLCAFSVADPARFGTVNGGAPVLGMTNVTNPATWAFGKLLHVHRHPLAWLQWGCSGVVILDHRSSPPFMSRKLGDLLAEDEAHARDLRMMLCHSPCAPASIKFPRATARRAAA